MKYVSLFIICALFASCFNEGDCLVTATNNARIQFRKNSDNSKDSVVHLWIEMPGQGTLSYRFASQILLPLDINQDLTQSTFIIHLNNSDSTKLAADTLKINYSKQARIISKDCGAYTFYQNLKVAYMTKHHGSDSVRIKTLNTSLLKNPTGSSIDPTSYAVNLQIFY